MDSSDSKVSQKSQTFYVILFTAIKIKIFWQLNKVSKYT